MTHVSCIRGGARWGPAPSILVVAVFPLLGLGFVPWALRPLGCLILALGVGALCVQGGRVEFDGRHVKCTASSFTGVRHWQLEGRDIVAVLATEHGVRARTTDGAVHVLAEGLSPADAMLVARHLETALHE